jgi:hypothetical protein
VHVFQMFGFLEATRKAMRSVRRFVKQTLPNRRPMENSEIDSAILAGAHAVRDEDAKLEPEPLAKESGQEGTIPEEEEGDGAAGHEESLSGDALEPQLAGPPAKPPTAPASPSRVLRRLPSNSSILPRPRHSSRASTGSGTLRVRPRSNSHPSLRLLMDEFERSESAYDSGSDGETAFNTRHNT